LVYRYDVSPCSVTSQTIGTFISQCENVKSQWKRLTEITFNACVIFFCVLCSLGFVSAGIIPRDLKASATVPLRSALFRDVVWCWLEVGNKLLMAPCNIPEEVRPPRLFLSEMERNCAYEQNVCTIQYTHNGTNKCIYNNNSHPVMFATSIHVYMHNIQLA